MFHRSKSFYDFKVAKEVSMSTSPPNSLLGLPLPLVFSLDLSYSLSLPCSVPPSLLSLFRRRSVELSFFCRMTKYSPRMYRYCAKCFSPLACPTCVSCHLAYELQRKRHYPVCFCQMVGNSRSATQQQAVRV